jgi:hypothetical protein
MLAVESSCMPCLRSLLMVYLAILGLLTTVPIRTIASATWASVQTGVNVMNDYHWDSLYTR